MEPVAEPPPRFADLLRQLRTEARLTQEELADAAGVSPRSVSDLDPGINRTARKDTALLLAGALSLTGQVRAAFVAAARGRAPRAAEVMSARRAAPRPPSGRHRELGARHGEAKALNGLGEVLNCAARTREARDLHSQALAIARDLGAACALEGIGQSLLHEDKAEAAAHLLQALAIYERIGSPGARRVQDVLSRHGLFVAPPG
jgi:transcriptional regulator with XRE-family HTH domain